MIIVRRMDNEYDLSDLISRGLFRLGINQSQLARKSGVSKQTISDYINRKRPNPDTDSLAAIAEALEIPIETIYDAAGIPISPKAQRDATLRELDLLFDSASPEQRDEIIRYARYILSEYTPRPLTNPSPSQT